MKRYFFLFQNDEFQSTIFFCGIGKKKKKERAVWSQTTRTLPSIVSRVWPNIEICHLKVYFAKQRQSAVNYFNKLLKVFHIYWKIYSQFWKNKKCIFFM